jgi:hypothetical protein
LEFSPPGIGNDGSKNAEEINQSGERVINNGRSIVRKQQFACQINGQDRTHSIVIESLAKFVADNEEN